MTQEKEASKPAGEKAEIKQKQEIVQNKNIVLVVATVIVVLVVIIGILAVGKLAKRTVVAKTLRNQSFGMMDGRGFGSSNMMDRDRDNLGGRFAKGNEVEGKVTAVNDKQFTIDYNGTATTVQISDSTRFPVNSATKVAVSDKVIVWGEKDSNGIIQAIRITVNPDTIN